MMLVPADGGFFFGLLIGSLISSLIKLTYLAHFHAYT